MMYSGGMGGMQRPQQQYGGGYVPAHAPSHAGVGYGFGRVPGLPTQLQPRPAAYQYVPAQQQTRTLRSADLERLPYAQYPNQRSYVPQQHQQQHQQFACATGQQVIYARQPRIPAQFHQVRVQNAFDSCAFRVRSTCT